MKKASFVLLLMVFCCILAIGINAEGTTCTEHHFEKADLTVAPTCKQDGTIVYTCSLCGTTETKTITSRHAYHSEVTKKATCTTTGTIKHTCTACGDSYTETTQPIHAYHEEVITAPTCTVDGVGKKTCSLCNASVDSVIPAAHEYTNVVELYAPSCFEEGTIRFDCAVCNNTGLTASIPATHENETSIAKPATCTEEGIIRHTCIYCNATHTDIIAAKHTYDVLNGQPTSIVYTDYTSTGVKNFKCDNCDATEGIIANPIFVFLGYSATPYVEGQKVDITCGYTVDVEALKQYRQVMGDSSLAIGVVGAYEDTLGEGVAPLVSATGDVAEGNETTVTNQSGNLKVKVKRVTMGKSEYATINANLTGIDYDNHATYFYICLYIYDSVNQKTVYISDDSCRAVPLPISYAMLVNGDDNHDDVAINKIQFGDISYSTIEGTIPDQDRLSEIASSAEAYKTEEATSDSRNDENTVAQIGSIGSFVGTVPNANALLNYYLELGGDATHYRDLDVESLVSDNTVANASWMTSINNILRAAELMAIEGETVNIDQTSETTVQLQSSNSLWGGGRDWYLSFIDGFYYTDTDLNNLTVTVDENGVKTYSAEIVYMVIDYYSFLKYMEAPYNEDTSSFLLWGPTRQELAQLHLDGNALDFLIESSITYKATWTEGERPFKDANFDKTTIKVGDEDITIEETYTRNNTILEVIATSKTDANN